MIKLNNQKIEINYFSDGTFKFLNCPVLQKEQVSIHWFFENNEELLVLYMLTKHLRTNYDIKKMHLFMPYIPNNKIEQVEHSESEVFCLKYFCDIINDMKFDAVYVMHPHSNVSMALLNNCFLDKTYVFILTDLIKILSPDYLFYSNENCRKHIEHFIPHPYIFGVEYNSGEKLQNIETEIITNNTDLKGKTILLIEDLISDGNNLLLNLKKLKDMGVGECNIFATHTEDTIFNGELLNCDLFTHIYTTNSILTKKHNKIAAYDLKEEKTLNPISNDESLKEDS